MRKTEFSELLQVRAVEVWFNTVALTRGLRGLGYKRSCSGLVKYVAPRRWQQRL